MHTEKPPEVNFDYSNRKFLLPTDRKVKHKVLRLKQKMKNFKMYFIAKLIYKFLAKNKFCQTFL